MEWTQDGFSLSDDPARVDLDAVCALLAQSYWAAHRPREVMARALAHSICFSLFDGPSQIGFARVVTDRATFAWICDVIVAPAHRGRGLGKWMMGVVTDYPAIRDTQQILRTRDAHSLYAHFGFEVRQCMRRRSPSWRPA
ncbi:MAG: GNAT family N-acetyltransferase [Candidatus Promineifilaceae bacterium]